jgi:hypothetical protein
MHVQEVFDLLTNYFSIDATKLVRGAPPVIDETVIHVGQWDHGTTVWGL